MIALLTFVCFVKTANVSSIALPNGWDMRIVREGSPTPGARNWTSKGVILQCINALGALEPNIQLPHSHVSDVSASFTDPSGKGSGNTGYTGLSSNFYEGEKVTISLSASKMSVGFRAFDCADGKALLYRGASDPPGAGKSAQSFSFVFQPKEGKDRCSMTVESRTTLAPLYSGWSWAASWVFTPGERTANDATSPDLGVVDVASFDYGKQALMQPGGVPDFEEAATAAAKEVKGVTADGVSLLLLRANAIVEGTVVFRLGGAGGGLYPFQDQGAQRTAGSINLPVKTRKLKSGKFVALALYRPPSYFGMPNENVDHVGEKPINFSAEFTSGTQTANPTVKTISLIRPPVVLVHGTYDNPTNCYLLHEDEDETPECMADMLRHKGYEVFVVNWEDTNGTVDPSDFQTNRLTVFRNKDGIKDAIESMRSRGYASTQADLVCHSQGGVIARVYARGYPFSVSLPPTHAHYTNPIGCKAGGTTCWYHRPDNFYLGDIHRLITVSTTHRGSHVCNLFNALRKVPDDTIRQSIDKMAVNFFVCGVDKLIAGVTTGGYLNQTPDSIELQLIGPTPIPAHAIACTAEHKQMKDLRVDPVLSLAAIGSIPGIGSYWNKLFKVYMGTPEAPKQSALDELATRAEANGHKGMKEAVEKYKALNAMIFPHHNALLSSLPISLKAFDLLRPDLGDIVDQIIAQLRFIVFEGEANDCTVSRTSSWGLLQAPFISEAKNTLHGWAPRSAFVQSKVLELLSNDGSLFDPNGFPGYTGIKSNASQFIATIPPANLPTLTPTNSEVVPTKPDSGANGAEGKKEPKSRPVQTYLSLSDTVIETPGVNLSQWKFDKSGTAVMNAPWAKVTYKVKAPKEILADGAELTFEIEATPVAGQRVSSIMTFRMDDVKREPPDRDLNVYVESGATAVTKKDKKVFKVSMLPDTKTATIWITMTDGPSFYFKYGLKRGVPGEETTSSGIQDVVGTWDWAFAKSGEPQKNGTVSLKEDGTMAWSGGNAGTWSRTGKVIRLSWGNSSTVDVLDLSVDGRTMEGVNDTGVRIRATRVN